MPFEHDTGVYNVRGSLTAWLQGWLLANVAPAVGSALLIVFDNETAALNPPSLSVSYLGEMDDPQQFEGGHAGVGETGKARFGMMEVDLWASKADQGYRKQLAQMSDVVTKAFTNLITTGASIAIYDFYTSDTAPAVTGYHVRIDRVEDAGKQPDPNPEIESKRIIVTYSWVERV